MFDFLAYNLFFDLFFFLLWFLIILSCLFVVFSTNTVHSIFFLILVFFFSSILLLSIKAEFLGFIFIIIYVGAIAVLFLFIVMMLNVRLVEMRETVYSYLPVSTMFVLCLLISLNVLVANNISPIFFYKEMVTEPLFLWVNHVDSVSNIKLLSYFFFFCYVDVFLFLGVLLLLAMLLAIHFTLTFKVSSKKQLVWGQVNQSLKSSIYFI